MKKVKWLDDAVFYEIYPQSFNDTNADGIGDFQGIIDKLDYIKETGFNAIWMNPCFASPFGDAGYDVADYYKAAPRYGTNEDLKRLFEEVHKRDMHILLDLVPGHTSTEHKWFKESIKPEKNEFTDRYVWTDSIWESPDGMGSLRGISDRDGSCACNFFSHQPALNYGYYERTKSWQQAPEDEGPQATLEEMKNVNSSMYRDIKKYPKVCEFLNQRKAQSAQNSREFYEAGVRQGLLREDVNFDIFQFLVDLSMNGFLNDEMLMNRWTLTEVLDTVVRVNMRGICTEKGQRMLDDFLREK